MRKNKRRGIVGTAQTYLKSQTAIRGLRRQFGKHVKSLPAKKRIRIKIIPESSLLFEIGRFKKKNPAAYKSDKLIQMLLGKKPVLGGTTPNTHCNTAINMIKSFGRVLDVPIVKIEGRVKNSQSLRRKLMKDTTFNRLLNAKKKSQKVNIEKDLQKEWIGIRVVVPTEHDLRKLSSTLRQLQVEFWDTKTRANTRLGLFDAKNYIENPRKDGLILGEDPSDEYRALHLFTYGLTGAPMEIQVWTADMEKNIQNLNSKYGKKYGAKYWKSPEFRRGKKNLGDMR